MSTQAPSTGIGDPWASHPTLRGPLEVESRLAIHHALQPVAALGQHLAPRSADDSQQSLAVDARGRLLGVPAAGGALRAALDPVRLELQLCDGEGGELASFPLVGASLGDGLSFLRGELERRGLATGGLALPVHPADFPVHPLGAGAIFPPGDPSRRQELVDLFRASAGVLDLLGGEAAGPVRLWPHHFDLARTVSVGVVSVGLGFSPGEGASGQPYWYATLWPRLAGSLPPLRGGGSWRTEGWFGAELPIGRMVPQPADRRAQILAFHQSALEAARSG